MQQGIAKRYTNLKGGGKERRIKRRNRDGKKELIKRRNKP